MMRNKRILGGALLLSMSLLGGGLNMGFSNNGQPAIVKAHWRDGIQAKR